MMSQARIRKLRDEYQRRVDEGLPLFVPIKKARPIGKRYADARTMAKFAGSVVVIVLDSILNART